MPKNLKENNFTRPALISIFVFITYTLILKPLGVFEGPRLYIYELFSKLTLQHGKSLIEFPPLFFFFATLVLILILLVHLITTSLLKGLIVTSISLLVVFVASLGLFLKGVELDYFGLSLMVVATFLIATIYRYIFLLVNTMEELKLSKAELEDAYFNTIRSLVIALEEKDAYTAGHSERVTRYAVLLAGALGWNSKDVETLRQAALVHDIGKIGLPDNILHKKGPLTEEEMKAIHRHPSDGSKVLGEIKFFEKHLPTILYHHERYDGKGYPYGLAGEVIPQGAQIIAISDAFDAMTTGRAYKDMKSVTDAFLELERCKGTQFNPKLVDIFISAVKKDLELMRKETNGPRNGPREAKKVK